MLEELPNGSSMVVLPACQSFCLPVCLAVLVAALTGCIPQYEDFAGAHETASDALKADDAQTLPRETEGERTQVSQMLSLLSRFPRIASILHCQMRPTRTYSSCPTLIPVRTYLAKKISPSYSIASTLRLPVN